MIDFRYLVSLAFKVRQRTSITVLVSPLVGRWVGWSVGLSIMQTFGDPPGAPFGLLGLVETFSDLVRFHRKLFLHVAMNH